MKEKNPKKIKIIIIEGLNKGEKLGAKLSEMQFSTSAKRTTFNFSVILVLHNNIPGNQNGVLNFQGVDVDVDVRVGVVLIRVRREEGGFVGQKGKGG